MAKSTVSREQLQKGRAVVFRGHRVPRTVTGKKEKVIYAFPFLLHIVANKKTPSDLSQALPLVGFCFCLLSFELWGKVITQGFVTASPTTAAASLLERLKKTLLISQQCFCYSQGFVKKIQFPIFPQWESIKLSPEKNVNQHGFILFPQLTQGKKLNPVSSFISPQGTGSGGKGLSWGLR